MGSVEEIYNYLQRNNVSPTSLRNRSINAIVYVYNNIHISSEIVDRLKLIEACVLLLYNKGHRMYCARSFLLGKIKRLEELLGKDKNVSSFNMRGDSSVVSTPQLEISHIDADILPDTSDAVVLNKTLGVIDPQLLDINKLIEIDNSQDVLQAINRSLCDNKLLLEGINKDINNIILSFSSSGNSCSELDGSFMRIGDSLVIEQGGRTPPSKKPNLQYINMAGQMENVSKLSPQEDFGPSSGRFGDVVVPGIALPSSSEGLVGGLPLGPSAEMVTMDCLPDISKPMEIANSGLTSETAESYVKRKADGSPEAEEEDLSSLSSRSRKLRVIDDCDKHQEVNLIDKENKNKSVEVTNKALAVVQSTSKDKNVDNVDRIVDVSGINMIDSIEISDDGSDSQVSERAMSVISSHKYKTPKRSTIKKVANLRGLFSDDDPTFREIDVSKRISELDLLSMSNAEIGSYGLNLIKSTERLRVKSKNISGPYSRKWKNYLIQLRDVMETYMTKIDRQGDVEHLMRRNEALMGEIKIMQAREDKLRSEFNDMKSQFDVLTKEIISLKKDNVSPETMKLFSKLKNKNSAEKHRISPGVNRNTVASKFSDPSGKIDQSEPASLCSLRQNTKLQTTVARTAKTVQEADVIENNKKNFRPLLNKGVRVIENIQIRSARSNLGRFSDDHYSKDFPKIKKHGKKLRDRYPSSTSQSDGRHDINYPSAVYAERETTLNREVNKQVIKGDYENRDSPSVVFSSRTLRPNVGRRKVAVVTINAKKDCNLSYADMLRIAREKISLGDLGIDNTKIKSTFNGGYKIEVPGANGVELAGRLKNRLEIVLKDVARVGNPVARGELRIIGIAPSTSREEIIGEVASLSGFPPDVFKVSEVRSMRDGMGIAWVQCPLNAAISVAETGYLRIGWTRVRVELMKKKPIQCFRCWRFGHVRQNCSASEDRQGSCFRCGQSGHLANICSEAPHCVVCAQLPDAGCAHRLGSYICLKNNGFSDKTVVDNRRKNRIPKYGS